MVQVKKPVRRKKRETENEVSSVNGKVGKVDISTAFDGVTVHSPEDWDRIRKSIKPFKSPLDESLFLDPEIKECDGRLFFVVPRGYKPLQFLKDPLFDERIRNKYVGFRYSCKRCQMLGFTAAQYSRHCRTNHGGEGDKKRQTECPIEGCSKKVVYLARHLRDIHPDVPAPPRPSRRITVQLQDGSTVLKDPDQKGHSRTCNVEGCPQFGKVLVQWSRHMRQQHSVSRETIDESNKEAHQKLKKEQFRGLNLPQSLFDDYQKHLYDEEFQESVATVVGTSKVEGEGANRKAKEATAMVKHDAAVQFVKITGFSLSDPTDLTFEAFKEKFKVYAEKKILNKKASTKEEYCKKLLFFFRYLRKKVDGSAVAPEVDRMIMFISEAIEMVRKDKASESLALQISDEKRAFKPKEISDINTIPFIQQLRIELYFMNAERANTLDLERIHLHVAWLTLEMQFYNGQRPLPLMEIKVEDIAIEPKGSKHHELNSLVSSGNSKTKEFYGNVRFMHSSAIRICISRYIEFVVPRRNQLVDEHKRKFNHLAFCAKMGGKITSSQLIKAWSHLFKVAFNPNHSLCSKTICSRVFRKMVVSASNTVAPHLQKTMSRHLGHDSRVNERSYDHFRQGEKAAEGCWYAAGFQKAHPVAQRMISSRGHRIGDEQVANIFAMQALGDLTVRAELAGESQETDDQQSYDNPDMIYCFDDDRSVGDHPDTLEFRVEFEEEDELPQDFCLRYLTSIKELVASATIQSLLSGADLRRMKGDELRKLFKEVVKALDMVKDQCLTNSYRIITDKLIFCPELGPMIYGIPLSSKHPQLDKILKAFGLYQCGESSVSSQAPLLPPSPSHISTSDDFCPPPPKKAKILPRKSEIRRTRRKATKTVPPPVSPSTDSSSSEDPPSPPPPPKKAKILPRKSQIHPTKRKATKTVRPPVSSSSDSSSSEDQPSPPKKPKVSLAKVKKPAPPFVSPSRRKSKIIDFNKLIGMDTPDRKTVEQLIFNLLKLEKGGAENLPSSIAENLPRNFNNVHWSKVIGKWLEKQGLIVVERVEEEGREVIKNVEIVHDRHLHTTTLDTCEDRTDALKKQPSRGKQGSKGFWTVSEQEIINPLISDILGKEAALKGAPVATLYLIYFIIFLHEEYNPFKYNIWFCQQCRRKILERFNYIKANNKSEKPNENPKDFKKNLNFD
jgi:hypothetical protein